jgi:hypothetical protein
VCGAAHLVQRVIEVLDAAVVVLVVTPGLLVVAVPLFPVGESCGVTSLSPSSALTIAPTRKSTRMARKVKAVRPSFSTRAAISRTCWLAYQEKKVRSLLVNRCS